MFKTGYPGVKYYKLSKLYTFHNKFRATYLQSIYSDKTAATHKSNAKGWKTEFWNFSGTHRDISAFHV